MAVIEGPPDTGLTSSASVDSTAAKVLMNVWREVTAVEHEMLGRITFAELVRRARRDTEHMYYI